MILADDVVVADDDDLVGLLASNLIIASGTGAVTVAVFCGMIALSCVLFLRLL